MSEKRPKTRTEMNIIFGKPKHYIRVQVTRHNVTEGNPIRGSRMSMKIHSDISEAQVFDLIMPPIQKKFGEGMKLKV